MWTLLLAGAASAADLAVGPAQPFQTLAQALSAATSGDRVLVDPGTYVVGELQLDAGLVLEIRSAMGPGTVVLRGSGPALLDVRDLAEVTLAEIEFDGEGDRRLARISSGGRLVLDACDVHDTDAGSTASGGAVVVTDGALVVSSSTFTTSTTGRDGGFLSVTGSTLTVSGSRFTGGVAAGDGGAIAADAGSDVTVTGSTFSENTTGGAGTLRCFRAGICRAVDTLFDGNQAAAGAAVSFRDTAAAGMLRATVCRSTGATAVLFEDSIGLLSNNVLLSNTLDDHVVLVDEASNAAIANNTFAGNVTDGVGVAVRVDGEGALVGNLVAWHTGPTTAVSTAVMATSTGGYQAYWRNTLADTDTPLDGDLVGIDPLVPEPAPGGCDAASLAPPPSSPLVDAGDPAILDRDGSRSDIGAWGGPEGRAFPPDADADGSYEGADCDDANPAVHPSQVEARCNGIDDDCDPETPDDEDADLDEVSVCAGDCDDADPLAFPGGEEVAYDGVDQDCDGEDLDDVDADGVPSSEDCDDLDPKRSPEVGETPDDGIDQDCTGHDASARLQGAAGVRCGCATGGGGTVPLLALALLSLRRRRSR